MRIRIKELTENDLFERIQLLGKVEFLTAEDSALMDLEYFKLHSGERIVSPAILALLKQEQGMDTFAKLVSAKYADRWNRIYFALMNDYDPITNTEIDSTSTPNLTRETTTQKNTESTESGTGDDTTTKTGDRTLDKTGSKTGTDKGNVQTDENNHSTRKEDTNISTSTTSDGERKIYGFNSPSAVGSDVTSDTGLQNVTGEGTDNVIDLTEDNGKTESSEKTSTETTTGKDVDTYSEDVTRESNTSKQKTGQETGTTTDKQTGTKDDSVSGYRDVSPASLLDKEIKTRLLHNLHDIMYNDVDSIMTLCAY